VLANGITFGGGANYVGEMKRGTDGAVGTPKYVEAHTTIDGIVKYQINREMNVQLNVYNLLDEDYAASINKSGYRYTPGIPRSVRLTLNVGF
jgi:catecholate siderophore receptor